MVKNEKSVLRSQDGMGLSNDLGCLKNLSRIFSWTRRLRYSSYSAPSMPGSS